MTSQTLKLQGGAMSQAEIAAFEKEAYFRQAIRLRRGSRRTLVFSGAFAPNSGAFIRPNRASIGK
jgi:hypothetical protein